MSKSTISIFQLAGLFPNEDVARVYLDARIWPAGPRCPDCGGDNVTARTRVGFYRCNPCKFDFTIRTNTIFERSKVPLRTWIFAMYLVVTARKGISSMQLAKELQVTQKTAWFILARLREACSTPDNIDKLKGVIEIDEAFFGGKEKNKHEHKKLKAGRGAVGKTAVLGMRERGGRTRAQVVQQRNLDFIHGEIHANVEVGSRVKTPEELDLIVGVVLGYRPPAQNKKANSRAKKLARKAKKKKGQ